MSERPSQPLPSAVTRTGDRPWVSAVFFYWYEWDEDEQWGNWTGQGVYYRPLVNYYDSRKYEDNLREFWMASEWGLTHHFIDFWGFPWKDFAGQQVRENVVFQAAEEIRRQGYPLWVSFYQDGQDFEMSRFRDNAAPGRHLRWILENYARSPVFPHLQGRPFYLVYCRNGAPIPSEDAAAFQAWLRARYSSLDALNAVWETSFADWEEVSFDTSGGLKRADAIRFYFDTWAQEWQALEQRLQQDLDLSGVHVSQDVAYQPYKGFGYSRFADVFGGPHSYAGIFAQPHDQDVQRFIQAAVAKQYGTVFFDHFKNFYNDWEIRLPGISYPPDPFHFDRFWVGDLARYAEAILHLSWNEWWEGSVLEPCHEYGKTYCQKNLFYSTLMHRAFPSIQDYARDAQVAVLLNDWQFLVGSPDNEELYTTIQTLRALTVPFELIPDDFVTTERLQRFRLVIAPAADVGFGENAQGQPIAQMLEEWAQGGEGRRLLTRPFADRLEAILAESGIRPAHRLRGESTIGTVLEAGSTLLALAYHHDITQPTTLEAELTVGEWPVAEAVALSADGTMYRPLAIERQGDRVRFSTTLHYYGVYALVRCPLALEIPPLRLHPGECRTVAIGVRNLTDRPVQGSLRLNCIVPTLESDMAQISLQPGESASCPLTLKAKQKVDWGHKTVTFEVETGGQVAHFVRELVVARLPDIEVATPVVSSRDARLTLVNRENGSIPNAAVEQATLEVNGQTVTVGDVASGESVTVAVPLPAVLPDRPRLIEQTAALRYRAAGQDREQTLCFLLADQPDVAAQTAPPGALCALWVSNGRETAAEQEVVVAQLKTLDLPPGTDPASLVVRDPGGTPLPTQVDFGSELLFPVSLPPRSTVRFWVCAGAPLADTDLRVRATELGSGQGTLALGNGRLQIVLDESRGGTTTTLRSAGSGRDYGAGAFGATFGHFGAYNPLQPTASTDRFIREDKVRQRDSGTASLRVLAQGPLRVIAEVRWQGEPGVARQVYELRAFSPELRIESVVIPDSNWARNWQDGDEVVVLDVRLARHHWTKIFPNFTGVIGKEPQVHGGWRQTHYVPPVATLMQVDPRVDPRKGIQAPTLPPGEGESLSLLLQKADNLNLFRQGFWPDRRPEPGSINWAEIEYGCTRPEAAAVKVTLLFHDGTYAVAEKVYNQQPLWLQPAPVGKNA